MTQHMTEAWVGQPGDGLLLRPQDRESDGSVVSVDALLETDGLTAQRVVVHHYSKGFDDLLDFFEGMARDWRGWRGTRTFVRSKVILVWKQDMTGIYNCARQAGPIDCA